ncbi:MAG: hypothetical protein KIT56_03630 [Gammaproteobacteria bacterium]|nr:hypothetical protein [Gammaproteobacteria bacterium]MCW5582966.1 hypothetical protein [Gammaproteobacteria bacterium]
MQSKIQQYLPPNYIKEIAKEKWYDWEAASILCDIDPKQITRFDTFHSKYELTLKEPQELLDNIKTWYKPTHASAPPFWYVNESIKKGIIDIPRGLLNAIATTISRLTDSDKQEFIESYPYLANELNISPIENQVSSPEIDKLKKIIDMTYNQFWKTVDPNKPPKKEEITNWIATTFNVAKSNAEIIDTLIKPEKYCKGGNRSRKPNQPPNILT